MRLLIPLPATTRRLVAAVGAALLASALSPVAGIFVGLGATALVLTGHRRTGSLSDSRPLRRWP